jgi:hypothetical protein
MNPFTMIVIAAEAGIQKNKYWTPHQVRHDMSTKIRSVGGTTLATPRPD